MDTVPSLRHRAAHLVRVGGLLLALGALMMGYGLQRPAGVSHEAEIYETAAGYFLQGTTIGRQAMVSSAWYAPVHILLRLPLVALLGPEASPASSMAVAALAGVGCLALLARVGRRWGLGRLRWLPVLAMLLYPPFLRACTDGSGTTTALLLVLWTAAGLLGWAWHGGSANLVRFAFGLAGVSWLGADLFPWCGVAVACFMLVALHGEKARGRFAATLTLGLLPALYALAIWVLLNWLVMSDGLYFLRPAFAGGSNERPWALTMWQGLLLLPAALLFLLALVRRRPWAMPAALLLATPLLLPWLPMLRDWPWSPEAVLACAPGLAILGWTTFVGHMPKQRALAVAIPLCAMAMGPLAPWSEPFPSGFRSHLDMQRERIEILPAVTRQVESHTPYGTVFVAGYEGLELLGSRHPEMFVPSLDFDFQRAVHDYPGRRLYLLVHEPKGRSRMNSIHHKFRRIYALGGPAMYDGDFGPWRLFEIIELPRPGVLDL